jgi:hypothetical protein
VFLIGATLTVPNTTANIKDSPKSSRVFLSHVVPVV